MKQMRDGSVFSSESSLTPLNAENSSDSAANLIRGMIYAGELPPGDWLPPLRELAARLGISVLTLRVALKSLESVGFIVTSRGAHGGTRITDINALTQCWMGWMRDKGDDVDDLWEFREIVETNIASLAAQRRTQDELRAIDAAWASAAAESHTRWPRPPTVVTWRWQCWPCAGSSSFLPDSCCVRTEPRNCATYTDRYWRPSAAASPRRPQRACVTTSSDLG